MYKIISNNMKNLVFGLGGQELLVVFCILFILIIPFYFMIRILMNNNLSTNSKILWLLVIFILSFVDLIVFIYSDDYKRMKGEYV